MSINGERKDLLCIHLQDQTQTVSDSQPVLKTLLDSIKITVTIDSEAPQTLILNQQRGVVAFDASSTTQVKLEFSSPLFYGQPIYLIGQEGQPIPISASTITLDHTGWTARIPQKNPDGQETYSVTFTILPPALLLNFRQDAAGEMLTSTEAKIYDALKPYFTEDAASLSSPSPDPLLSIELLSFYKAMGNSITFFIHGYNVDFGAFQSFDKGTGACGWLLAMEYNLNQAAGFDGENYLSYTRIIGIAWQGDPTSSLDYMAAVPLAGYPARRLADLIQQFKQEGIAVNLMAHSLGNAVLMSTLEMLSTEMLSKSNTNSNTNVNITVDHVFLWEAAIPDTCFNSEAPAFLPMILNDQTLNNGYSYPNAYKAATRVTVLYSGSDSILSSLPSQNSEIADVKVLWETDKDPGGGIGLASAAVGTALVQDIVHAAGIQNPVVSIYHLANLYVYPIHYFIDATDAELERYYQGWKNFYQTYQSPTGVLIPLEASLSAQQAPLRERYPKLFAAIEAGVGIRELSLSALLGAEGSAVAGVLSSGQDL